MHDPAPGLAQVNPVHGQTLQVDEPIRTNIDLLNPVQELRTLNHTRDLA